MRVILGSGQFSWNDTRLTAACLALFAIGVVFQNVVLMLDRSYYAGHKTKVPVITNLFGSATIVLSALLLPRFIVAFPAVFSAILSALKVSDVNGTEVLILPLAFSVGALANFVLEWLYFKQDFKIRLTSDLRETVFQSFSASVIMALVTYISLFEFAKYFNLNTFAGVFLQGALSGIVGIIAGVFVLVALKNQEVKELIQTFKNKFGMVSITIPSQEQL